MMFSSIEVSLKFQDFKIKDRKKELYLERSVRPLSIIDFETVHK